jgi:nicotinamidase-related amidase
MVKPALIVIDMVNDLLRTLAPDARQRLLEATGPLVATMRSHARPVIWVRQEFAADLRDAFPEMRARGIRVTIEGTQGARIDSALPVDPADPVIVKKRYSAFHGTELDRLLARIDPDGIILAGITTHACIRMSAIDAYQRDWSVVLAAQCIDSYDREHHEISLRYMSGKIATVMSNDEIRRMLEGWQVNARN